MIPSNHILLSLSSLFTIEMEFEFAMSEERELKEEERRQQLRMMFCGKKKRGDNSLCCVGKRRMELRIKSMVFDSLLLFLATLLHVI